ncbi:IS30 family transposase, partial [Pontimonas sp.]|uniref:IS30 family transposase n=1 Tax=Pontimonas sp. TaxID=2304492 RepID=UPI002870539C
MAHSMSKTTPASRGNYTTPRDANRLADLIGVPTYFCDPYSAWQRGTNEHFNGRLRRYIPKKTRFDTFTQEELDAWVHEINNRPRKVLNWSTPAEVFQQLCSQSQNPQPLHFQLEAGGRP